MTDRELLQLVKQYQSAFGHRVPSWAGKNGTAEKIAAAIAAGHPVVEWKDYKPNPQNFFALENTLRREIEINAAGSDTKP